MCIRKQRQVEMSGVFRAPPLHTVLVDPSRQVP
jgi:hypothetical protein